MDIDVLIKAIQASENKLEDDDINYIYCILMSIIDSKGSV